MAMEDAITKLAHECMQRQEVGTLTQSDGTVLLIYPLERGIAIGLGTMPGFEHRLRSILLKRSGNLPRYSIWMPALLNDGSCFVVMRVANVWDKDEIIDSDTLAAAVELIS
jgi:hypothetical protein